MKKIFCDLCDEPAASAMPQSFSQHALFEKTWDDGGGKRIPKLVMSLNFGFRDRRDGFGGPPDLCLRCQVRFLEQALQELNSKADGGVRAPVKKPRATLTK